MVGDPVAVAEVDGGPHVAIGECGERRELFQNGVHRGEGRIVGRLVEVEVGLEAVAGGEHDGAADRRVRRAQAGARVVADGRQAFKGVERRSCGGSRKGRRARVEGPPGCPLVYRLTSHGTLRIASPHRPGHGGSRLVRALRGDRPDITPVWFMRQAGRSLPEYRAVRGDGAMLGACLDPAIASEVTMQPVRRHGVDAAIFFSDIVVPLALAGVAVEIAPGRGPVFAEPVRTSAAVAALTRIDPARVRERAEPVADAVCRTVALLAEESDRRGEALPLIGFAGAPFTLAAYLVEGGPSKDHLAARRLLHEDPEAWRALMQWLAALTGAFLAVQVESGASAAQLFDSWAGALAPDDYRTHVLPASRAALDPVRAMRTPDGAAVPLIHFGVGTGEILPDLAEAGVDAVGVDYRVSLRDAAARIGRDLTLQGNLDPALLFAPAPVREAAVERVLTEGTAARAHVFNLGHGFRADVSRCARRGRRAGARVAPVTEIDVCVIGAGVAGLVVATESARAGLRVAVIDPAATPGGLLRPQELAGVAVDAGAESYALRTDAVETLVADLALRSSSSAPSPAARISSSRTGRAASVVPPLPARTVIGIPADPRAADVVAVIGSAGAERAARESALPVPAPGEEPSLDAIVRARLGDAVADLLVDPVCRSVYSQPAAAVRLSGLHPALWSAFLACGSLVAAAARLAADARTGSAVGGIRGGMWRLPAALAADAAAHGALTVTAEVTAISESADGFRIDCRPSPGAAVEPSGLARSCSRRGRRPRGGSSGSRSARPRQTRA